MSLTQDQIQDFETKGFLSGIQVADEAEALRYRQCFNQLETAEGREKCEIGLLARHFDQEFIWELASHPRILDCIESLMGPDIMVLGTHFFCKYGPREKFVAWHQDTTYWGLEPPNAISAWYAVDDSDEGNGCMRVIPGTHRRLRAHGKSEQKGNLLSINQELPVTEDEENQAVDLILKAGQVSIHHGKLIHGSLPNHSTRRRCGLAIPYISPSVKQVKNDSIGRIASAILVRGEDKAKHFGETPKPFPLAS